MNNLNKIVIVVSITITLLSACKDVDPNSDEIIPIRRVERAPNELVYVDKDFTPDENRALIEVLNMENIKYYTDNNGKVYISAYTVLGESKEMFFWSLTEEVYSHMAQKQLNIDTANY